MKLIHESLLEITIDFLKEIKENDGIFLVGLIEDLENTMKTSSVVGEDTPKETRRRRISDQTD
jgi:hypothetical protein